MARSALAAAVGAGRPVLTVSLGTLPRPDEARLRERLRAIREPFGFVKFGDNPRARARVSPWAAATLALSEGVEPVVHVGCRDRNRLALEADLLGGRLLNVPNILCLRGDEMEVSDQPDARSVRDLDVVELIALASGAGEAEPAFCVLAACDPAIGLGPVPLARLRAKLAAGARILETQPVFDLRHFAGWLRELRDAGIETPVLADVSVVASVREAELLESIPYVQAPTGLADRVRRDPGAGVALAAELVAGLLAVPGVAGCHLSPLGGDPAPALAVAERVGWRHP